MICTLNLVYQISLSGYWAVIITLCLSFITISAVSFTALLSLNTHALSSTSHFTFQDPRVRTLMPLSCFSDLQKLYVSEDRNRKKKIQGKEEMGEK